MGRFDAKNEGYRVHTVRRVSHDCAHDEKVYIRIGLSRTIGANNRGEIRIAKEENMVTLIGLKVKELETYQLPHRLKSRLQLYLDLGGAHAREEGKIVSS